MTLKILFLGDIVGDVGRKAVYENLANLKLEYGSDVVIANGENSAGGRGITEKIAFSLFRVGVNVITLGDHVWDQKEIKNFMLENNYLLRPANFPTVDGKTAPGVGWTKLDVKGVKIGVTCLLAQTYMGINVENPFNYVDKILEELKDCEVIFVEFHGEASSEKVAFANYLDGKVSAVVGTHTHIQTAEPEIFPKGTAFLADAGMCGPIRSVIGRRIEPVIKSFKTSLPQRFPIAKGDAKICGVSIEVDLESAKVLSINSFRKNYKV